MQKESVPMNQRPSANRLLPAAALFLLASSALAQKPVAPPASVPVVTSPTVKTPDRSAAYYHDSLAHLYEELAVNQGRPDFATQAVEEYKLALNADPGSKYLQDGLAELYLKIGRIREAVTSAQEQIRLHPDDLKAHVLLGKVYLRSLNDMQGPQATEMLQLAIGEYQTIAKLQPADLETHLILGQLYGLNHDSAKAEAEFKLARAIDSNSEEAVLSIARLYTEQGQPQRAVDLLQSVPAQDRSSRLSSALGAGYDQLHKPHEAAEAYRAALEEDDQNVETQRALAAALMADDQLDAAQDVLKQLIVSDPADTSSQVHLAEAQRRTGHYTEALATLEKAKAAGNPGDTLEILFNEGLLYDTLGKYDQAESTLLTALSSTARLDGHYSDPEKSNRALFLERLAVAYRAQGKLTEAIAAYQQIVALGGDFRARGYNDEIEAYREAHQWKEAVATAASAAKTLPADKSVQLNYAYQLADTGQAEKGIALEKAQIKGNPASHDNRDVHLFLSNTYQRLNRSGDALAELDQADASSATPDEKAYVALLRARVYDHDKKYDQAAEQYHKVLTVDPNNATVLNDYGFMLADRGVQLQEALTMIQKAVKLEPQEGAFLDSLGWIQYRLGQYGPAEDNLKKAIDRNATDPTIHDHLGDVYEKTGRLKLAVDQWERSMTEYAHSLPADAEPAEVAKVKHKLDEARTRLAKVSSVSNKKS